MNAPNAGNERIGRQLWILTFGEHAILELDLAIIEQKFQAVASK